MARNAFHRTTLAAAFGGALSFVSAFAVAEEVEVPVGQQGFVAEVETLRGLEKEQVTTELGEPVAIDGPVGEPAISRWEYTDFYVYFEWDKVLHVVAKPRG